jgi:hypothetical protein
MAYLPSPGEPRPVPTGNPLADWLQIMYGLGSRGHPPQRGVIDILKDTGAWDDPAKLAKARDRIAAKPIAGDAKRVRERTIGREAILSRIDTRIGDLEGTGPFANPDEPVFGNSQVENQQMEPVFGLPMILGATIPSGVYDIFKGSTGAKAIAGAKTVLGNIPKVLGKGVSKGGSFGGIVVGTIAQQGLSGAIDAANASQDAAINRQMKDQDAANRKAVEEINKRRRLAGQPIYSQQTSADRSKVKADAKRLHDQEQARQKALNRKAKKDAAGIKAAQKSADRAAKKAQKSLEAKNKRLDQQAKAAAKAADKERKRLAELKSARWKAGAKLFGTILIGAIGKKPAASKGQSNIFNLAPPMSPSRGASFSSLRFDAAQGSRTSTLVASKTAVAKCRSDTPKRKKGFCRSGFFKETPNRTTYKVWSERKCQ